MHTKFKENTYCVSTSPHNAMPVDVKHKVDFNSDGYISCDKTAKQQLGHTNEFSLLRLIDTPTTDYYITSDTVKVVLQLNHVMI